MQDEEFTWMGALMVFWALTWRVILIVLPLAICLGVITAVISIPMGIEKETGMKFAGYIGNLAAIPVYIYVIKRLFTKGFGKYRLAVLEKE